MIEAEERQDLIVRGIFHCHTSLSYDSQVDLRNLCAQLYHRGFNFVALTEHARGVSSEAYEKFVVECLRVSSKDFIVIPGLEIRCNDGVEIAGIGISKIVAEGTPYEVVKQIREMGGYAVWVHPFKRGKWNGLSLDCDAIEVLNGKIDGTVAPSLSLLNWFKQVYRETKHLHAIFGLDLHNFEMPINVWIECRVDDLTHNAIIESFRTGHFVNRIPYVTMTSYGKLTNLEYILLIILRLAYLSWNAILGIVPDFGRKILIQYSRLIVSIIKRKDNKIKSI